MRNLKEKSKTIWIDVDTTSGSPRRVQLPLDKFLNKKVIVGLKFIDNSQNTILSNTPDGDAISQNGLSRLKLHFINRQGRYIYQDIPASVFTMAMGEGTDGSIIKLQPFRLDFQKSFLISIGMLNYIGIKFYYR